MLPRARVLSSVQPHQDQLNSAAQLCQQESHISDESAVTRRRYRSAPCAGGGATYGCTLVTFTSCRR
jgi:hypothetical protein